MLSCLCYGKPGVPSMRFNLPNCVACVEKGNDVISSKIGPDYFNAFCFDRTITIQQMVLGIYKLGAEQQFPRKWGPDLTPSYFRQLDLAKHIHSIPLYDNPSPR